MIELSKEYRAAMAASKRVVGLPATTYPHAVLDMPEPPTIADSKKRFRIVKIDGEFVHGKKLKHVIIEATFPELRGGKMYQSAHGEASGTKPAIARAFRELLKKVPGKRVSVIQARISITTKTVEA